MLGRQRRRPRGLGGEWGLTHLADAARKDPSAQGPINHGASEGEAATLHALQHLERSAARRPSRCAPHGSLSKPNSQNWKSLEEAQPSFAAHKPRLSDTTINIPSAPNVDSSSVWPHAFPESPTEERRGRVPWRAE